jgi:hypothetical protein
MSTIDMPETQEEDNSNEDEDKAPGDDNSVLPVATFTNPISWFADMDYAMLDANGPVDPLGWQFQGRDGRWMSEDNDRDLKRSLLDYSLAAFPPTTLKRILTLTNKSLRKNGGKEIELGELLRFFGVVLLITKLTSDADTNCGTQYRCSSTSLHPSSESVQECAAIASKRSG